MPINYQTEIQRYRKYYKTIEPKLNKPSSRAYTTIIFSFLVVSLFGWYAIRPTIQTILYLQREIRDKTELSKKMEDKITALIEAQAYYQEIEPLLPVLDDALPTKPDAVPIMIQLRNLASISGTLITSVQLPAIPIMGQEANTLIKNTNTSVANTAKQQAYELTLAIRGPYKNIRAFIDGLLQMRRIVTVDTVTLLPLHTDAVSSNSGTPTGKLLQLALKLKTYYLIE